MADYTDLSNAAVGVGGIPSGATVTALRDNPIAITEGAVDAPRIQGLAAADEGRGLPILTVAAADTVTVDRGAGAVVGITSTTSTSDVVAHTNTILSYTGAMRFGATHAVSDVLNVSTLSLYRNDVLVMSWTTSSLTAVARTVDSAVAVNDVFEWRHRGSTGVDSSVFSNPTVKASDGYVLQHLYAKFSGL